MTLMGYIEEQTLRAIVRVNVIGASREAILNLEIDTGAGPELILSEEWSDWLGLPTGENIRVTLADGSKTLAVKGLAEIVWFDAKVTIEVAVFGGESNFVLPGVRHAGVRPHGLIGRKLLRDASLTIDYPSRRVILNKAPGPGA